MYNIQSMSSTNELEPKKDVVEQSTPTMKKRNPPSPAWVNISDIPGGFGTAMAMAMNQNTEILKSFNVDNRSKM